MKFKRLALVCALTAIAGGLAGFSLTLPTVDLGGGVTGRVLTPPSPGYIARAAVGVFEMWPSLHFPVNGGALMAPNFGFSTLRKRDNTGGPIQPGDTGGTGAAFRIECATSHMGFFDPIVYPPSGSTSYPKKSHLHTFFGNSDISATTAPTTDISSVGRSSCVGGTANRSGYWVPAVIDTTTGFPVVPSKNVVYYKNETTYRLANPTVVTVPPAGLRIIAGNPANTSTTLGNTYRWECPFGNTPYSATIPSGGGCTTGSEVGLLIFFPQCWDGVNLDSANHQDHMAYENSITGCPGSHPVMIPQISFNIHYQTASTPDPVTGASRNPANWRLASDTYTLGFAAGGLSAHGDWWNGWDQSVLTQVVEGCLHAQLDCHAHLLGLSPNETLY